jgi:hydroxymethylpyrimidine/phosphomethylpyrimidine kinase
MQSVRPYVLTIAGFDPCSGAGLTADVKTFEQLGVYGLSLCTGYTLQSENEFVSVEWRRLEDIQKETQFLLKKYDVKAVKFGIVPSLKWISELSAQIKNQKSEITIIVDPVWKSSTGFEFADFKDKKVLSELFERIDLLTPNTNELKQLNLTEEELQQSKTNILVKGGHNDLNPGTDYLYSKETKYELKPTAAMVFPKHGSGCVLSAAITAHLALGKNMITSCKEAKAYIEKFLTSNKNLLGYHAA